MTTAAAQTFEAANAATGEVVAHIPRNTAAEVDQAVRRAHAAFPAWRSASPLERASVVNAIADVVDEHAEELSGLDVADNGSPIREMRKAIASGQLRYFAGLALQLRGDTIPGDFDRLDYTLQEPLQAGFVWVNDSSRHFPGVPFGGVKDSGVGREEDVEELYSYAQTKNVNVRFG